MKRKWISKQGAPELLIFFNGWGMDEKPFVNLNIRDDLDVIMFYDYTDIEKVEVFKDYEALHLVAWSLGVFAAAQAVGGMNFVNSVAVNGTLNPINEDEGISPAIFQGTIDSWSEVARKKFNRRMCGRHRSQFEHDSPNRAVEDQKAELIALKEQIENTPEPENIFKEAVIGVDDRIFTREAQERYWKKLRVPVKIIDEPHYFFPEVSSWHDLLK
jgi:biotin synthesis protein BioG